MLRESQSRYGKGRDEEGEAVEVERGVEPVPVRVSHLMGELGRPDQRLGRNAAKVQAIAAHPVCLHDGKEANQSRDKSSNYYPIGKLGDDVEVHFLHYKDEETARKKWYSRRERINMNNLFVEFSDRNLCEKSHLLEFDRLDFRNKVVFTAQYHPDIKSSVWLNEYVSENYIKNIYVIISIYKSHFDVADWLNGGSGRVNSFLKILNNVLEEEEWWKFADVETLKRFKLTE